ncbi:hypothetical protein RPC_1546 [Rhodopseudomonas palustris BisB18]|uniref:Uncharacterized protein n=1 Tax=Rhodopseudomonas palustris (strain BisB18) TaxID=316056 RepID=Q218S8_RHOPB
MKNKSARLDLDQSGFAIAGQARACMSHLLYRCPRTNMNVQTWLHDDPAPDKAREFEAIRCPACTQTHFIDRATGKLLGDTAS